MSDEIYLPPINTKIEKILWNKIVFCQEFVGPPVSMGSTKVTFAKIDSHFKDE